MRNQNKRPCQLKFKCLGNENYLRNDNSWDVLSKNYERSLRKEEEEELYWRIGVLLQQVFCSKYEGFSLKRNWMYSIDKFFDQINVHFHQHLCCLVVLLITALEEKKRFSQSLEIFFTFQVV